MNKLFNNTVVLTTQNPEAFLNFNFKTGDASYWICPSANTIPGDLYVNGLDINSYLNTTDYALQLNYDNSVASFNIYTRKLNDFNYDLKFLFYSTNAINTLVYNSDVSGYIDVSIYNRPDYANLNVYDNSNVLVDGNASYLILRSNPKFTGNIKIVVDTSNNIFLDTFKISDTLSNKKYRHQQISANSILSNDIRNTFSSLPVGELFNLEKDITNISIPKTKYADQYDTTYNYGARLLEDELYPQDNAILAPLWLNNTLPNYFCVFRVPGVYNPETYDNSSTNLANKYLSEGELIKSWSLLPASPLGKYLNTHLNELTNIPAPVFLSLTDPSISTAESDPNTWYGITVDSGVIAGRSETPYFFNQKINNFTELNAFVSQGFERNNILCPNLLNLEYIFNDEDVSTFTMNRYYGLYLTENVLYKIGYYSDTSTSSVNIVSFDGKDISAFLNSGIFDYDGSINSNYSNRIFIINDGQNIERIFNSNQITQGDFVSVPNNNLFSTPVIEKNYNPFITLTLNTPLRQGEHLRVVNKTKNKIWEIYGINNSLGCDNYISTYSNNNYPTICQTYFDVSGNIEYQLKSIENAFNLFSQYEDNIFSVGIRGNNWISLVLNNDANPSDNWVFQRITSQTLNTFIDPSSGFNGASSESDITFFGIFTPTNNDVEIIKFDSSYGPINFEIYGNRRSISIDFFSQQNDLLYSFYDTSILVKFEDPLLYQGYDNWYKPIQYFNINTNLNNYNYQYVLDPLSLENKFLIQAKEDIQTLNNTWNAYDLTPINISLMGINSVKDIDYVVYDSSTLNFTSEYEYARDNDVSTYQILIPAGNNSVFSIRNSYVVISGTGTILSNGSYTLYTSGSNFNTFFGNITLTAATDTIVTYNILDGNKTYSGYTSGVTEENISDYFIDDFNLKYSLITPTVSKWVGLGSDCRNNDFRLNFNASLFDDNFLIQSNYIPYDTLFTDEFTYPSYKYLTPGVRNWQDYIFNDINDSVQYFEDTSVYNTIKELMFLKPYTDIFSKLIYYNNNVNSVKNRSSIVNYNDYNQSISVIFLGLNLSFSLKDSAKNLINIKNYDNYRFSLVSTSSKNRDTRKPIEVIINENTQTILMVWYQGNDVLNYTLRNSSYLPGKSLMDSSSNYIITDIGINTNTNYSFIKTPFFVNNSKAYKPLYNLYGDYSQYDSSTVNPYAQLNYGPYHVNSIWNAFTKNNTLFNGMFNSGLSYNTFSQIINYDYYPNVNTFGNNIINYGYKYQTNENLYYNNTCELATFSEFIDPNQDYISFYIIRENIILSNIDFYEPPIEITINSPREFNNLYTYNGWFSPKFKNILEFKNNEDSNLIETVNQDFILSNTDLIGYNKLDQVWYNNVVNNVTSGDASAGNAISYYPDFDVFKSQWDANYYYNSQTNTYVAGYQASEELPAFFGSKLIKLPAYIELSSWDSNTGSVNATAANRTSYLTFSFNLSRAIAEIFKSNSTFLNNWAGLSNADNIITAYIDDTIMSYYNISIPKIKVQIFHKTFDTQILYSTIDSNFIEDLKLNYSPQLTYKNDEYIYNISIPSSNNYSYFIKFTLFEK